MQQSAKVMRSVLVLGVALAAGSCQKAPPGTSEQVAATKSALAQRPWRTWYQVEGSDTTKPIRNFTSVAICSAATSTNGGGYMFVGQETTTNRYLDLTYVPTSWTDQWNGIGVKAFASKPMCASLDELNRTGTWNNQVVVTGKTSDGKYWIVEMSLSGTSIAPTPLEAWHNVNSTDTYDSAAATVVAKGTLLVLGRRSNGQFWIYKNVLATSGAPYNKANWQNAIQVTPTFPSGWTPAGDPVIANTTPLTGLITIVTRATKAGNPDRLYYLLWDGASYWGAWTQIPSNVTVLSDPAIEVDLEAGVATLYFRGTNDYIYQGSGINTSWQPFGPTTTDAYPGATPSAIGNLQLEGHHFIAVRKSSDSQIWDCAPNLGPG